MSLSPRAGMTSPSRRCRTPTIRSLRVTIEVDVRRVARHDGQRRWPSRPRSPRAAARCRGCTATWSHQVIQTRSGRASASAAMPMRIASSMPVGCGCTTTVCRHGELARACGDVGGAAAGLAITITCWTYGAYRSPSHAQHRAGRSRARAPWALPEPSREPRPAAGTTSARAATVSPRGGGGVDRTRVDSVRPWRRA